MAVTMMVKLTVKPGQSEETKAILCEAAVHARLEPGCDAYACYSVEDQSETIYVLERWADEKAFEAHREAARNSPLRDKLFPTLVRPPEYIMLSQFGEPEG